MMGGCACAGSASVYGFEVRPALVFQPVSKFRVGGGTEERVTKRWDGVRMRAFAVAKGQSPDAATTWKRSVPFTCRRAAIRRSSRFPNNLDPQPAKRTGRTIRSGSATGQAEFQPGTKKTRTSSEGAGFQSRWVYILGNFQKGGKGCGSSTWIGWALAMPRLCQTGVYAPLLEGNTV